MFLPRIILNSATDVVPQFDKMIKQITSNRLIMDRARQYDASCSQKYDEPMSTALNIIGKMLDKNDVKYLVQSSYSASVYIDNPGDVDLDIVALYDTEDELDRLCHVAMGLGFQFLEKRNVNLPHMIHYVYTKQFESFIIELKLRRWETYKEHLYKIHKYLDALPKDVRIAWRYIRMTVMKLDDATKKKVKYLWYMYGAIKTGVRADKDYFPMNIYY